MSALTRPQPHLLAPVLLALAVACAGKTPPPEIPGVHPVESARSGLVYTVTVPSLSRLMARADAVARAGQLDVRGEQVAPMMLAPAGLDPAILPYLDPARPIASAFVATEIRQVPRPVTAFSVKTEPDADRLIAWLTPTGRKLESAVEVRRGAGGRPLWLLVHKTTFLAANDAVDLRAFGALALTARDPAITDDVLVSIRPEDFARWQGAHDAASAVALVKAELGRGIAGGRDRALGPTDRATLDAIVEAVVAPLSEASVVQVGFSVDDTRGLRGFLHVRPRPGTALARRLGAPAPYAVDPAVLGGPAPFLIAAAAPISALADIGEAIFAAQARAKIAGAAAAGTQLAALRSVLGGAFSLRCAFADSRPVCDAVAAVPGGIAADRVLDTAAAYQKALGDSLAGAYGRLAPTTRIAREGHLLRVELTYPMTGERRNDPGAMVKDVFGSNTLTFLATVAGGRLIVAQEPGAQARLTTLAGPATGRATPELATTLQQTHGSDGVIYADLVGWFRALLGLASLSAGETAIARVLLGSPLFANLRLPVHASIGSGGQLTMEVVVPLSTLTTVGTLGKQMGALGGAGLSLP